MNQTPIQKSKTNEESIALSRRTRWFVFICFCCLNSSVIISNGVVSAAVSSIKDTFKITDKQLGLVGTCFNAGSLLGSLIFMSLINILNRKWFLIIDFIIHVICLICDSITNQFYIFLFFRSITGACLVVWFIYTMIWIDQFGVKKWKSWMMTIINLSGQVSMLWGYLLNSLNGPSFWAISFRIEAVMISLILVPLMFVNSIYFSKNLFGKKQLEKEITEKHDNRLDSMFFYNQPSVIIDDKATDQDSQNKPKNKSKTKGTIFTPMYIIIVLAKSAQFFVMVTVGFWFSDYSQSALNVFDDNQRFLSFSISCTVANIFGLILSGIVSTSIGGYDSKNALLACSILKAFSTPFGAFIPFTDNFIYFSIAMFGYNLFDSASILISNSLILVTVPNELKGMANALFSILANFLAFLPSTFIYGYLKTQLGHISQRLPLGIVIYYGFTSLLFFVLGLLIQSRTQSPETVSHFDKDDSKTKEYNEILLKDITSNNKA